MSPKSPKPVSNKPAPKATEQVSAPPATEQPKAKAPAKKRDRSSLYDTSYKPENTHVITVVQGKGKRPGTKAGSRWAVLAANSGKTVEQISAAYEAAKIDPKRLRNDLRWNLAHGLIADPRKVA